jgi:hypothetical protein
VERWAAWFRGLGQDVQVQSSNEGGASLRERGRSGDLGGR